MTSILVRQETHRERWEGRDGSNTAASQGTPRIDILSTRKEEETRKDYIQSLRECDSASILI